MDVFGQFLEARSDSMARVTRSDAWEYLNGPLAPPARLLAFDRWVRKELSTRLQWPGNEAARARQIEQSRILVERLVLDLWRRGWMLDGKRLATHITAALDAVAKAQAKGQIRDLYAYLRRSLEAYVGVNAEEIQAEARRHASGHIGVIAEDVLMAYGLGQKGPSIPELVAQRRHEIDQSKSLRQALQEARRKSPPKQPPDGQQEFL